MDALPALVAGSRTLRWCEPDPLRREARFDSLVIVGPTCAGKTALTNAIRSSPQSAAARIAVPKRYITRPPRRDDSAVENIHLTHAEFERRRQSGEIALGWTRRLEHDRLEQYGFARVPAGVFAVYSGNNAVLSMRHTIWPNGALDGALFLGVDAPDDVRQQRLRQRSPDLWRDRRDEVLHRLAEGSIATPGMVAIVVENHGELEDAARGEVVRLAECLADAAARPR